MRIDRIVVGVDLGPQSSAAARWIAGNFPHAEITLVHCVAPPHVPRFLVRHVPPEASIVELAREGAARRLDLLRRSLDGAHVSTEVRIGHPVDEISAAARAHAADLIAVATTGMQHDGHAPLGHTAERLARCAPVPVLLCTGMREQRPSRLLVAIDDAEITGSVLMWARTLAAHFEAHVTAVHVVSSAVLTHLMSAVAVGTPSAGSEPARADFRHDTDRWIAEMVAAGLDARHVTSEVDFGDPGQELIAAARRLDSEMIILGSKGAGAVRRSLLGSVVSEVLHRTRCPVLVVVEPEDQLEE